jgi:hypothetical protein
MRSALLPVLAILWFSLPRGIAQAPAERGIQPFGSVTVDADFELKGVGVDVDTPCIWEAPDPADTLLFVSAKGNSLVEIWKYPFQGNQQPPLKPDMPVNAVAVDRVRAELYVMGGGHVKVFGLPGLAFRRAYGDVGKGETNGDILHLKDGQTRLYVSSDHAVHVFDAVTGKDLGFTITPPVTSIETLVCDDFHQCVHVPEEEGVHGIGTGVHVYHPDGALYDKGSGNRYGAQAITRHGEEGIALYKCPCNGSTDDGRGWVIVTEQIRVQSRFHFFDRQTWGYLGDVQIKGVSRTDGIATTQRALPAYPSGVFAAVDRSRSTAIVSWQTILKATGLGCGGAAHAAPDPAPTGKPSPTGR